MVSTPAVTPVTSPTVPIVAFALLALHTPPASGSDNMIMEPGHIDVGPDIGDTYGDESTVTTREAIAVPHPLVTVYRMVSTPTKSPLTVPPETDALTFVALHTPPDVGSVSTIELPRHTKRGPEINPAAGTGSTVTGIATIVLQVPSVTVYSMVSAPGEIPVTVPPTTLVVPVIADHTPPGVASVITTELATHTIVDPLIGATVGTGLMVTTIVVVSE